MKKTVVALGLLGVMALAAATAFAWGPGMGYGPGPGAAALNLSEEQVAKIQQIRSERYADMAAIRGEMFTKRTELQALFREPALDHARIAAKQQEIAALQAEMQAKALATRTAVAEVLTPEQRAQMPAFGPGMGPGFGRGRGMGFGPRW
jgi:Spy/CpxP family protein refolding chaperone